MIPNKKKRRKLYKMEIDDTIDNGVFAISLVSEPAIEELFVYLSKQPQLIKLAEVDNEKRILVGPVLIPNKEIPRIDEETGEEYSILFTPEVVEKAAQLFLQNQNNNEATIEHTEKKVPDVSVVESWIIADPEKDKSNVYGMSFPKGTWMAMMKINNDEVWQDYVKTGKVKGFSLEGMFGHLEVENTWGVEDVPSTSSSQGYPNNTQYPHNINNAPYDVPYNERQLAKLSAISLDDDRAFARETVQKIKAVLMGKEVEMQSYTDYPDSIKNNAKRGIELNDAVENRCATQVGKIRAQQLANGEPVSLETIKRMYSYLSRAEAFYDENDTKACGTISYLLWGGLAAKNWSESKLKELGEVELEGTTTSISSSYAGQFGEPKEKKKRTKVKLQVEAPNLDVFGYPTKHFEICPGAQAFFQKLVSVEPTEETVGMIRSMAHVFEIEKNVLANQKATPEELQTASVLVEDFYDILEEVAQEMAEESAEFMENHLEIIARYVA